MKAAAKKQYEAHVAFELQQLAGDNGAAFVEREIRLAWDVVGGLPLSRVVKPKQIMMIIQRRVIKGPVTDELLALIGKVVVQLIRSQANYDAKIGELITDENRKALVAQSLSLTKLRNDLIHAAVANPLYADVVSDLLYNGIADYLAAGTEMTKKVPGMGSLMNKGGGMLAKRMGSIEDRLRGYISGNMQSILNRSEAMLKESLTEQRLTDLSEEVWKASRNLQPRIDDYVSDDDIVTFVSLGADLWKHFRATPYFRALVTEAVDSIFADAGKKPLAEWGAELGITIDLAIDETKRQWKVLEPVLAKAGYLEAATRERLEPFYAQL